MGVPPGCMPSDANPRGITIYTLNFSNKAGMSYTDEICNIPVGFVVRTSNGCWVVLSVFG